MVASEVVATPARVVRPGSPPIRAGGVPDTGLISEQRLTEAASQAKIARAGRSLCFGTRPAVTAFDAFNRAMVISNTLQAFRDRERIRRIVR